MCYTKVLATRNTARARCSRNMSTPAGSAARAARGFSIINKGQTASFSLYSVMKKLLGLISIAIFAIAVSAQLRVPQLPIQQRKLPNGLTVVSVRDNLSPSVAIHVWYNVGSKNDPAGRNGFAHLFEHIMFKSTKNMPSENMDRLTEDVGGYNNASTWDDFTNYYEVIPSNHLETLLWAEAERMANLTVDDANFKSERAVVEEELRQSYLAR